MNVLVDASVWSLALRRGNPRDEPAVLELRKLIGEMRAEIIGPIRQELLSGIRERAQFEKLRGRLAAFVDLPLNTGDHELAADYFNRCRSQGLQGSNTDFLICAVAVRRRLTILTTDLDFPAFARHLPIQLWPTGS